MDILIFFLPTVISIILSIPVYFILNRLKRPFRMIGNHLLILKKLFYFETSQYCINCFLDRKLNIEAYGNIDMINFVDKFYGYLNLPSRKREIKHKEALDSWRKDKLKEKILLLFKLGYITINENANSVYGYVVVTQDGASRIIHRPVLSFFKYAMPYIVGFTGIATGLLLHLFG